MGSQVSPGKKLPSSHSSPGVLPVSRMPLPQAPMPPELPSVEVPIELPVDVPVALLVAVLDAVPVAVLVVVELLALAAMLVAVLLAGTPPDDALTAEEP